jgi:hypothetical protein
MPILLAGVCGSRWRLGDSDLPFVSDLFRISGFEFGIWNFGISEYSCCVQPGDTDKYEARRAVRVSRSISRAAAVVEWLVS